MILSYLLFLLSLLHVKAYDAPPAVFNAADFTNWKKKYENSKLAVIAVPFVNAAGESDTIMMKRMDLVGDEYTRGRAHGALLALDIVEFVKVKLPVYYADMILNIDTTKLPEIIQAKIKQFALKAPEIFNEAMQYVYDQEDQYMPVALIDEMNGIAEGVCDTLGQGCNVTEWSIDIKRVNMLPELIRMACTAYGAWGKASSGNDDGTLVQVRALDFGNGPFANYTVVSVHRNPGSRAFVMVGFPGFVGAVTGIAQNGIGISEKVWMTYDKNDIQRGRYDGEPDVFVLRDILQYSSTREEAEAYVNSVKRTWAIFIGVGDFASQKFDIIGYKRSSVDVYDDVTMPDVTGQPYLPSVVYVDKHPQPSGEGPNGTLPTALTDFYGDISSESSRTILQFHETGDVHIAIYDYGTSEMLVSIGRINKNGAYGPDESSSGDQNEWKAFNRPYVKFDLEVLWAGN